MQNNLRFILSRTDGIGDVVLTLPVAYLLKKHIPDCYIIFLGKTYTKPIIDCCVNIDEFADWNDTVNQNPIDFLKKFKADVIIHIFPDINIVKAAYMAKIPVRISTSHRFYNLLYCNHLVDFSRKHSNLHETQLNMKLLQPLGIKMIKDKSQIPEMYELNNIKPLNQELKDLIATCKFNLVIHPKSKGNAREWKIDNYKKTIDLLPADKYKIFITGTNEERSEITSLFQNNTNNLVDLTGRLTLSELISFINEVDGLLACSTGPLHIAAALGKKAIGLYPPIKPMHPGRWAPVGYKAKILCKQKHCSKCRKSKICYCINEITPQEVVNILENDD